MHHLLLLREASPEPRRGWAARLQQPLFLVCIALKDCFHPVELMGF
jgi:hypothetical protein